MFGVSLAQGAARGTRAARTGRQVRRELVSASAKRLISVRVDGPAARRPYRSTSANRRSMPTSRASSSAICSACRSSRSARLALSRESTSARVILIVNHAAASRASPYPRRWHHADILTVSREHVRSPRRGFLPLAFSARMKIVSLTGVKNPPASHPANGCAG